MNKTQIKVGVIGSGTIGTDLVERMLRDSDFDVRVFIGRRENSPGLQRFRWCF
jgi:acetaldehyde dehydrogenase (acetylating)